MPYLPFVLLAVLGMLPATLLPVITAAVHGEMGASVAEAGLLGSATIGAAALGALAIAWAGLSRAWKRLVSAGLGALALLELLSAAAPGFAWLLGLQVACGLVGGVLTGVGYAAIGRSPSPERSFGVLVSLQFALGGLGIATLPTLIAIHGAWLLFVILAAAPMLLALPMLRVSGSFITPRDGPGERTTVPRGRVWWGLAALFLIQAGHTAGSSFVLDFGRTRGFGPAAIQGTAGLGGALGVIGAVAAAAIGIRFGRRGPVTLATVAGVAGAGLLFLPSAGALLLGFALGSIAWAFSVPYLLGACVAASPRRDEAMWVSFVAKIGLAAGPYAAALVVSGSRFEATIVLANILALIGLVLLLRLEATPRPWTA